MTFSSSKGLIGRTIFGMLISSTIGASAAFADSAAAVNNEGIAALNAKDYVQSIAKLKEAINIDPSYILAKKNLAIAYNNYGLSLKDKPKSALFMFHRAYYYDGTDITLANIDKIIGMMGRDPKDYYDRVGLGDKAFKENDSIGALLEYKAALAIKNDAETAKKLKDAEAMVAGDLKVVPNKFARQPVSTQTASKPAEAKSCTLDTNSKFTSRGLSPTEETAIHNYIIAVDELVKAHWVRPVGKQDFASAIVVFKVHPDGQVSDINLTQSSGDQDFDQNVMAACLKISGMLPPPSCMPPGGLVQMHFDYKPGHKHTPPTTASLPAGSTYFGYNQPQHF